jgi:hypothetical protein
VWRWSGDFVTSGAGAGNAGSAHSSGGSVGGGAIPEPEADGAPVNAPARKRVLRGEEGEMLAIALLSDALAGGQWVTAEVAADGTAVVARTFHCGNPATVGLTATAEGLVGGERKRLPLTVTRTGEGVYAVARTWPQTGSWVLVLSVTGERPTHALVDLDDGGPLRIRDQASTYEPPTPAAIDAALRATGT